MFYAKISNNLGLIGYICSTNLERLADEITQINGGSDGRHAVRCSNMKRPNNPLPEGDPVQNLDDLDALNDLGLEWSNTDWGGTRIGAGRPKNANPKQTTRIVAYLPPDAMEALKTLVGNKDRSRSNAITRAILEMDARENSKK
jgi:hypothetical protein